jgi:hypothetical protein
VQIILRWPIALNRLTDGSSPVGASYSTRFMDAQPATLLEVDAHLKDQRPFTGLIPD